MRSRVSDEDYRARLMQSAPNPERETYDKHYESLAQFNADFRSLADSFLDHHDLNDMVSGVIKDRAPAKNTVVSLACLGSDGRNENSTCSPLDIVAFVMNSGLDSADVPALGQEIAREFRSRCDTRLFGEFEVKPLEHQLSFFDGDPKKLWPDRVTDAKSISDIDSNVVLHARRTLVSQLRDSRGEDGLLLGHRVLSKIKERLKSYKKICKSGKQTSKGEEIKHFDLKEGIAWFNDAVSRNALGPSSFKQNALRLVQTAANRIIFEGVLDDSLNRAEDLVVKLPPNTIERLEFFLSEGLAGSGFDTARMARLQDNYKYFVWLYHRSEWSYSRRGETETKIDTEEVKSRMEDLLEDSDELAKSNSKPISRLVGSDSSFPDRKVG